MPRLILLLAIALAVYIALARVKAMPAEKQRKGYIQLGLAVAVVVVIGLTITGKMHWVGAAITALVVGIRQMLPTLIRFMPALAAWQSRRSAAAGHQSVVQTKLLRMILSHDTGSLSGEVLAGEFIGRQLNDLSRDQLEALMRWCQEQDPESVQLLSSYMQRRFNEYAGQGSAGSAVSSTAMSRKEALKILGLEEDAQRDAIIKAHRRLMQKLHPDRGGNDYLAAKINQAKDLLLA